MQPRLTARRLITEQARCAPNTAVTNILTPNYTPYRLKEMYGFMNCRSPYMVDKLQQKPPDNESFITTHLAFGDGVR